MKNTFVLVAIASMGILGLSPVSAQQAKKQEQAQKSRHVKMIRMENGKKMEIDTVFTGDEVFVWNGDTINPEKHIRKFSPSQFDKTHHPDGEQRGHKNVRIYRQKSDQPNGDMSWQTDMDDDIEMFTNEQGDSIQKKIVIHRRKDGGDGIDHMIFLNHMGDDSFAPAPPMPPMPPMRMMKMKRSKGMIDLNDPKVISYKKKDMSGGREKIEIIRKKSDESDNMNFDIQMPDPVIAPGAPHPQSFRYEFNDGKPDGRKMKKQIRVEVKEDGKTEEKVSTEETK